jgi:hypothetical protein
MNTLKKRAGPAMLKERRAQAKTHICLCGGNPQKIERSVI